MLSDVVRSNIYGIYTASWTTSYCNFYFMCIFFFVEQKYLGLQKKENTLLITLREGQTKTEPSLWKQMKKQTSSKHWWIQVNIISI